MPEASKPVIPICPRCGYDLGGTVASWRSEGDGASCPTEGVCSECGYAHLWRDILNPTYQRLTGFYEHARTRRERITWGWRTTLWLLYPWVFWGKVKLHHTMRPLRALRLAAWMILLSIVMRATVAVVGIMALPGTPGVINLAVPTFTPQWSESNSFWRILFDACFGPRMVWNYSITWPRVPDGVRLEEPIAFLIFTLAPIAFALSMAALIIWVLPETSRRAKMRPAHVWRAAAYAPIAIGLSTLASSLFACLLMASDLYKTTVTPNFMLVYVIRDVPLLLTIPWIMAFWWSAILRGLRLQHGGATCLLLTIAAGTATVLVSTLVFLSLYWTENMGQWYIRP